MTMDSENKCFTAFDYLASRVKFDVPEQTILGIMYKRGIDRDSLICDNENNILELAYADILKWFIVGPSKVNNTSDSDNGWTHSGGGYELSDEDRYEMKAEANAIYTQLEPDSVLKKKSAFRVNSHGVKRANYSPCGEPIPHIIK